AEIDLIEQQLEMLVRQVNPTLLSLSGVGPVTAATLLVAAGDNPERLGTRASFAALAGVAPIPASSGQRTRHRLSRGGNRHANAALHRIVLLRMRHREPRTMAYFERRRSE
ncbi:transposase, partial [Escherichia coli]|nr:transposase [Escherichia coli]